MIRSLRRKFILIASGAILLILTIVLVCVNGITYYSNYQETYSILQFIADNNGEMHIDSRRQDDLQFHLTEELPYETRYFSVVLDEENNLFMTDYAHIAAIDDEDVQMFFEELLSRRSGRGTLRFSDSLYMYLTKTVSGCDLLAVYPEDDFSEDTDYTMIVFMDCTSRLYRLQRMCWISVAAGLVCFMLFVLLVSVFSDRAVKPVIETYEKQKRFITDAGHELKTPLAIISANTEVIEAMEGRSEWTQSILHQVKRLSGLVGDLITLARLEESAEREEMVLEEFDFSAVVQDAAEAFRTVIVQQGKQLSTEIAESIHLRGNEKSLQELVNILIDNAAKYCDDGGAVHIQLETQKKQILLAVSNAYAEGEHVDYSRFFDRFYREDTSRNSEKSGYGIGLSMAESIVRIHKGTIAAAYKNGTITFTCTLRSI